MMIKKQFIKDVSNVLHNKVSATEYMKFSKWHFGYKDNPMRLGQSFLNTYFPNIVDTKLYYCDNDLLSQQIIFEKYIGE